ncbi:hypothetical protein [Arthrobacter russicus]|uniref:Uncharacterized protein n=1 Tax=Arthrobacter russicus TaxID=172040 RepID=A0ABU1JEC6_9MICC|nr:hypothetical protein [Arthrobacter russicus]MDR6270735.1 hypothetical protein [Arthrobacter russicus]
MSEGTLLTTPGWSAAFPIPGQTWPRRTVLGVWVAVAGHGQVSTDSTPQRKLER